MSRAGTLKDDSGMYRERFLSSIKTPFHGVLSHLYTDEFLSNDNDLSMKKHLFLIVYPIQRAKFSRSLSLRAEVRARTFGARYRIGNQKQIVFHTYIMRQEVKLTAGSAR